MAKKKLPISNSVSQFITDKPIRTLPAGEYMYKDRPNALYKKNDEGKWLINLGENTNNKFIPLKTNYEQRASTLEKSAIPVDMVNYQKQWLSDYISSPKYKERLKKELDETTFQNSDIALGNELEERKSNLDNAKIQYVNKIRNKPGYLSGMYYPKNSKGKRYNTRTGKFEDQLDGFEDAKKGKILLESEFNPQNWNPYPGFSGIPLHEMSHAIDDGGYNIPKTTEKNIYDRTKMYRSNPSHKNEEGLEFDYFQTPTEFLARMNALRFLMFDKNLYDSKTQNFTEENFNSLINNKELMKDVHVEDIFNSLKGDTEEEKKKNLIWLMNNIAFNDENVNNEDVNIAKYGGDMVKQNAVSLMGYRDDSPFRNEESLNIYSPDGLIDMSNVGMPIVANGQVLDPYSGINQVPPTKNGYVRETPLETFEDGGRMVPPNIPMYYQDFGTPIYRDTTEIPPSFQNGGNLYTYPGRPGAVYQKGADGNWKINLGADTQGKFIPIVDPKLTRTEQLNLNAVPLEEAEAAISSYDESTYFNDLKYLENSIKKGLKDGKWYPHVSPEGGAKTIAYGHKLKKGEDFSKGLSQEEAEALMLKDYTAKKSSAQKHVDKEFGKGTFENLDPRKQILLTDYQYNTGLSRFPKLTKAVVTGDTDTALKEYKRYHSGNKPLVERNKWTEEQIKSFAYGGNIYKSGGYTVTRSNDRKGKTHKVTRKSDGKVKYYGHPMKNQPKNKKVKEAAEARHRAQGNFRNPFFKAYWDKTWKNGGVMDSYNSYQFGSSMQELQEKESKSYYDVEGVNKEKLQEWYNIGKVAPTNIGEAKLLAEAIGYTPAQSNIVAAQWALESARGTKTGGQFNYFGIKSHSKATRDRLKNKYNINVSAAAPVSTKEEFTPGKKETIKSSFLNFDDPIAAFLGHKAFLETNKRYEKALKAENSFDFAKGLKDAGYATSAKYAPTLGSIAYPFLSSEEIEKFKTLESEIENTLPKNKETKLVQDKVQDNIAPTPVVKDIFTPTQIPGSKVSDAKLFERNMKLPKNTTNLEIKNVVPKRTPQFGASAFGQGQMFKTYGGKTYQGNVYRNGEILAGIGAGLYGAAEGILDTVTLGLTDNLTDKGFDALFTGEKNKNVGGIRGAGNVVGGVAGGFINPAGTGAAVGQVAGGIGEMAEATGNERLDAAGNVIEATGNVVGNFVAYGGNIHQTDPNMSVGTNMLGKQYAIPAGYKEMYQQNLGEAIPEGATLSQSAFDLFNTQGKISSWNAPNTPPPVTEKTYKYADYSAGSGDPRANPQSRAKQSDYVKPGQVKMVHPDGRSMYTDPQNVELLKQKGYQQEGMNLVDAATFGYGGRYYGYGSKMYNDYAKGGKLPESVLRSRLESHMSKSEADDYINNYKKGGKMIKRADGSYSQRGLWDNIRANKGSGKKPTKEMLKQEKKIKGNKKAYGSNMYNNGGFGMNTMNEIPVTEFNAGGTHEQNPLGGIPQGMGTNGKVNLVEQGELKITDPRDPSGQSKFIVSAQKDMIITKEIAEENNLPKTFVNKTVRKAADMLLRKDSRREGDTIEENSKQQDLIGFLQAHETLTAMKEAEQNAEFQEKMITLSEEYPEQMATIMPPQSEMETEMAPEMPNQIPLGMAMRYGGKKKKYKYGHGSNMYTMGTNVHQVDPNMTSFTPTFPDPTPFSPGVADSLPLRPLAKMDTAGTPSTSDYLGLDSDSSILDKDNLKKELARYKEMLDANSQDSERQSFVNYAGQLLPAALNVGMGLFGKEDTVNLGRVSSRTLPETDVSQQLRDARMSAARTARQMRGSGQAGSYLANIANLKNIDDATKARIYQDKYNRDAAIAARQAQMDINVDRANLGLKAQEEQYKRAAKAAKQRQLFTGLGQVAQKLRADQLDDIAQAYNRQFSDRYGFDYEKPFKRKKKK